MGHYFLDTQYYKVLLQARFNATPTEKKYNWGMVSSSLIDWHVTYIR